jgi:hypothetical protein
MLTYASGEDLAYAAVLRGAGKVASKVAGKLVGKLVVKLVK